MLKLIRDLRLTLHAACVSYWRKRTILRATALVHAQDLLSAPASQHPLILAQHAREIAAIKAGNLAFVDRRTNTNTALPLSISRVNQPVQKAVPVSLRRFSRTPVPARAINLIKAGILQLEWTVQVKKGKADPEDPDVKARIEIAKDTFQKPNDDDSYGTFTEQLLTDFLVYGAGTAELRDTGEAERPLMAYPVDSSTLQIVPQWNSGRADTMPRYAQVVPFQTQIEPIYLLDDEIMMIRDNIATDSPFGTGALEIAYEETKHLIGNQRMAGIAGTDQLGRQIFWWNGAVAPSTIKDMRDYLQQELEGMARVGMIAGAQKPEVLEIKPVSIEDLLLPWQEMLIRMIGISFGLSAQALGLERDVNRSTGEVLSDMDFRTAVLPVAHRFQEAFTRRVLHKKMGYEDLEMVYLGTEDPDISIKLEILTTRYQSNACTGNDLNRALGIDPIPSPFADLTMAEILFLQPIVQGMAKPASPSPFGGGEGGDGSTYGPQGGMAQDTDAAGANGLNLPRAGGAPTKLSIPKAPKLSLPKPRLYPAARVANMHPAAIRALQSAGLLPQSGADLVDQMQDEDQNILEKISEQVWEYLETLVEAEMERLKDTGKAAKLNKKWTQFAKKRYGKNSKRVKQLGPKSLEIKSAAQRGSSQQNVKSPTRVVRTANIPKPESY